MRKDDWITELYIKETLMKKINSEGLVHTIKINPLYINIADVDTEQKVFYSPFVFRFELEILTDIESIPKIQDLPVNDWFNNLFSTFDVISDVSNNNEEFTNKCKLSNFEKIMFVNKVEMDYILQTFYDIINNVLPSNQKLISIGYYES